MIPLKNQCSYKPVRSLVIDLLGIFHRACPVLIFLKMQSATEIEDRQMKRNVVDQFGMLLRFCGAVR